jgi:hypothetical protein
MGVNRKHGEVKMSHLFRGADLWDWWAELSGPGPFHSRGNIMATFYCHQTGGLFKLPDRNRARDQVACLFADVRRFKSEENEKFFPVRMEVYEAGPTFRLGAPVELGLGVGLIHFDSSGVKTNRFTLSFPRLVLKPLVFIDQERASLGFLQLYFRETRIAGELTQDNFRPKPGHTFRVKHDVVPSTGFIIDAVALVRLIQGQ